MHQNVTVAEAIVLSCFPSPAAEPHRLRGGELPSVRTCTRPSRTWRSSRWRTTRAIVDAIDERTLLVPISHVLFKNAEIQDIEPIVRRAHEVGAHVILDCYQSAGIVPFDLTALGVDFAVGGSVKWLCGGPGAGWLYVRPDLAERLEPTLVGWQGHARPFAFEPELEYAAVGAAASSPARRTPGALRGDRGLRRDRGGGVPAIRERSLALTRSSSRTATRPAPGRLPARARAARRHGHRLDAEPRAVHQSSASAASSATSPDPVGGIRLGPHFFNTEDEVRHAVAELAEIVASGAYERRAAAVARF